MKLQLALTILFATGFGRKFYGCEFTRTNNVLAKLFKVVQAKKSKFSRFK